LETIIEYVIAKIERLSQNENTRCHLFADPFGLLDLGKTNVFWTFTSYDGYNGKEHYFRWNGGKVDEHNIKQEY